MFSKKNTRRALLVSVMSLILCCAMLMGTTFAWFTDSVTSGNNIIKSGNLDVALQYKDAAGNWQDVTADTNLFQEGALWEPGHTEVIYLKVTNLGSLALNYKIGINVVAETKGINVAGSEFRLSDHIKFGVIADKTFATRDEAVAAVSSTAIPLSSGYADTASLNAKAGTTVDKDVMALVVYMPTSVDNIANHNGTNAPSINLGVSVVASQKTAESDSFGPDYDALAAYPGTGLGQLKENESAVEIEVRNIEGAKVGAVVVPAEAKAADAENIQVNIEKTLYEANITVADGSEKQAFDVEVLGLKDNNDVPVKVQLRINAGLDPDTVKLYHYNTEIPCTYDPATGYVTFESTSFSPFTVVFDAESKYVPPVATPEGLPQAEVTAQPEYVNTDIGWGQYGQWSPAEGLDSKLEAAYKFKCIETPEQAAENAFANWTCDFYVKLDRDLGENQIFLGGSYGDLGWIGFHNGEYTLAADEELPLLGSVTQNPWTYSMIANYVNEFTCGVGDVNDALSGATFTVMLRLTNPEDSTEFYNVATINYKFD